MKYWLIYAALVVVTGCTQRKSSNDTGKAETSYSDVTQKVNISPQLALSVDSARAHVRTSNEVRVYVVWKLHNVGNQPFDLGNYDSDEFFVRTSQGVGFLTNVSMGTDGRTTLEPGTSVSMLSLVDVPGKTDLTDLKLAPVHTDPRATPYDVDTYVQLNIATDLTSCDALSEICEAFREESPAYCAAIEGVTYPLAYPLPAKVEEACKARLAQARAAQAN
ncbi:MAG: hypothetical protein H7Z43_13515 [Clostridia bacterium]|nr:hypothetical protein [Deltaproteobacteria bacterium]